MFRGFTKKKVSSYTLGEQLKKIRSEGRITLHEVSRDTRIPVKYLEMIEEGRYESLPPDVYVKGFLRSYAEYFGIDSKKIINIYEREREIRTNLNGGEKKAEKKKEKVPRFVITPKILTVSFIVLVVLGGFGYLYKEIGRFAAVPRLVLIQPESNEISLDGNSLTIVGFTDRDAKLSINDQPVVVSDSGEFRENILLQEGMNKITVSATNRFNKMAAQEVNVRSDYESPKIAEESGQGNHAGEVSGEQDEKQESGVKITVRIGEFPTWLFIEADGSLVYTGTMLPRAEQEFKGEKEIRITSGKANQTFIRLNGGEEKVLADDPGIVRDVVFGSSE